MLKNHLLHQLRRLAVALLATGFLVAAPVATAHAAPAGVAPVKAAATSCYWISYPGSSNCDGKYPTQTTCGPGRVVQSAEINGHRTDGPNPLVRLYYSDSCRTTWARLDYGFSGSSGTNEGCHVEVHRPSGGYGEPVDPGLTFAYTRMLYDSGVQSYAYGYCDSGAWDGGAMTASY